MTGNRVKRRHTISLVGRYLRLKPSFIIIIAMLIGVFSGLSVVLIKTCVYYMHEGLFFGGAGFGHLSGVPKITVVQASVPLVGGLLLALFGMIFARYVHTKIVDPVEANALHGGRMSVRDSFYIGGQTLISNGAGASLGLEAGFVQICSALASRLGQMLRVNRSYLRMLVGCGAAGAIAAAFDAPLTGIFYALELVMGAYTLSMAVPLTVAALSSACIARLVLGSDVLIDDFPKIHLSFTDYVAIICLGFFASLTAICVMKGVAFTESLFRKWAFPSFARLAVGGGMVGALALASPVVLSSGHSATYHILQHGLPLREAALLILLKACASSISIGAGFRGGLFFASLLLGVLCGNLWYDLLLQVHIPVSDGVLYGVAGMCAFAVAVVGGPFTMIFLTIETTGSLPVLVAILTSGIVSAQTTRWLFGYSFTTWRFHLRGERIRSPLDVGRVRSLTTERLMQRDPAFLPADATVGEARKRYPDFSPRHIVLTDRKGAYAGIIDSGTLHESGLDEGSPVANLARGRFDTLTPCIPCREALKRFQAAKLPALAVLDDERSGHVVGLLSERYVLRRYAEQVDRSWQELTGVTRVD
ncbi:chloride channel protein [Acetobacter conturbans]|nr:chloride channel protein [Acetobacter conturbans]